jgi:hypothetical protein
MRFASQERARRPPAPAAEQRVQGGAQHPSAEDVERRRSGGGGRGGAVIPRGFAMSEYERLTMEEGDHDDRRYRSRTLQRWRLSMVMAFASGVMVTMVAYPRLLPCPDLASSCARAAIARCPVVRCPEPSTLDTSAVVAKAVEQAVSRCPTCPKCPDFPGCPTCPASRDCPPTVPCPSCSLNCPQASHRPPSANATVFRLCTFVFLDSHTE